MTSRYQGLFRPNPFFEGKALGTKLLFIASKLFELQNVISHPVFVVCTYCFRFSACLDVLFLKLLIGDNSVVAS